MNVLVNGCSFSRGPTAWPYHLGCSDLVNLACAGAGNDYIFNTTVAELSKRSYDFVSVMWTHPARIDIKVNDINQFDQTAYNSFYQSSRNDWAEKIIHPVNDQDYVEKDWAFGCGFLNRDPAMLKTKLFDQIYFHQTNTEFFQMSLIKIIALQNILKQMNIPYLFMYYQDYEHELQKYKSLYAMLDQSQIYNKQNIYTITKDNGWYDSDGAHPSIDAHRAWAEIISPMIKF